MLILLPSSADRENYGDADVGYVQLKREGHVCLVKAKICPEHKVRNKDQPSYIGCGRTIGDCNRCNL
nr:unnamed protein product [Callosobruchus analis]